MDVLASGRLGAAASAPAQSAEDIRENVFGPKRAPALRAAAELEPAGKAFLCAALEAAGTLCARIEAARMALGIDLTAVELGAFFLVAHHLLGGIYFLKALGFRRLIAMGIGVQFLGERTEGLLDLGFRGVSFDAKDIIGIAHCHGPI